MEIRVAEAGAHLLVHGQSDDVVIQIDVVEIRLKMKIQRLVLPAFHTQCVVLGKTQHVFSVQITADAVQCDRQPGCLQADDGIHGVRGLQRICHVDQ